ncbi:aldo/keto reductase [candidate division WOR-3 bacterium]|nr:aldo/keto reductase [candidate division WOR-3 bacterium]
MQYRRLGQGNIRVPVLGFGAMRLPMLAGSKDTKRRMGVDLAGAIRMMHRAFDLGINYFDTAWGYHQGWSEVIVRKALKDLPRDRVMIADKLPIWLVRKPADFNRFLRTQLRRLGTDYLDFYLLHGLSARTWAIAKEQGALDFLETARREGRIRHIAFSFHDRLPLFREIVGAHDWAFAQVQYNIVDTREQAGRAGVRYAAKRGLGIVVMEPLRGGDLVGPHPPSIRRLWEKLRPGRPVAEWLLRWAWDQPEVSMVLSGMSSMEQLEQNIAAARRSRPGNLTPDQRRTIDRVAAAYRRLRRIGCTGCNYCQPCPQGVRIPLAFQFHNEFGMFPESRDLRLQYRALGPALKLDACNECGQCVEKCPQQLAIPQLLKEVAASLAPLAG